MITMSKEEFENLKGEGRAFPVVASINADELTPITIFNNLKGRNKFLLESAEFHKKGGRYSFLGVNPYKTLKS